MSLDTLQQIRAALAVAAGVDLGALPGGLLAVETRCGAIGLAVAPAEPRALTPMPCVWLAPGAGPMLWPCWADATRVVAVSSPAPLQKASDSGARCSRTLDLFATPAEAAAAGAPVATPVQRVCPLCGSTEEGHWCEGWPVSRGGEQRCMECEGPWTPGHRCAAVTALLDAAHGGG